jgi:hypothetical protein
MSLIRISTVTRCTDKPQTKAGATTNVAPFSAIFAVAEMRFDDHALLSMPLDCVEKWRITTKTSFMISGIYQKFLPPAAATLRSHVADR